MHEYSDVGAITDLAKPVLAPALRLIIHFAGILNAQHMPPFCRGGNERRSMRYHFFDSDRIIR